MSDQAEALRAIDEHIALIIRRLADVAIHRSYLSSLGLDLGISRRTQLRLEAELADLREQRRFAAHRVRFGRG